MMLKSRRLFTVPIVVSLLITFVFSAPMQVAACTQYRTKTYTTTRGGPVGYDPIAPDMGSTAETIGGYLHSGKWFVIRSAAIFKGEYKEYDETGEVVKNWDIFDYIAFYGAYIKNDLHIGHSVLE